jgi:hypothetical protein
VVQLTSTTDARQHLPTQSRLAHEATLVLQAHFPFGLSSALITHKAKAAECGLYNDLLLVQDCSLVSDQMLRLQVVSSDGKVAEWSASAEEWQGCCDSSGYLSARESFASGLQAGDQEDASVQISAGWCTK